MRIKYIPHGDLKGLVVKHVSVDVVDIDGKLYDFSNKNIVEYNVSDVQEIKAAYRVDGILHLEIRQGYSKDEKHIWEDSNYYSGGGFRGSQFEDLEVEA
jgi:ligand-binding sensor domain-containing protein